MSWQPECKGASLTQNTKPDTNDYHRNQDIKIAHIRAFG